jgi:AraC-like DNA-binding protein
MPERLEIGRIGIAVRHPRGFTIDRPRVCGDVVFLHFLTPIRLLSRAGLRVEKPGACILYTPPHAQWYTSELDEFNHNWFHMTGPDAVAVLKRHGLPLNTVFRPHDTGFIAGELAAMQREKWRGDARWADAIALRLELFFLHLARASQKSAGGNLTRYKTDLREIFKALRVAIHENPTRAWRVPDMAKEVHLSPSRFAVLYREFFGTTPAQELIQARLDKATWLLMSTSMSVAAVAEDCGFNSLPYFSRLFRRRVGCTPREHGRRAANPTA